MSRIITLDDVPFLTGQEKFWTYCGLDCTGTREVFDVLHPRLDAPTERTYAFERGLQAPALAMMRRGVLVNEIKRKDALQGLQRELKRGVKLLNDTPEVYDKWDGSEKETGICPKNGGKRHKWPKGEPDATRVCSLCGAKRMKFLPFNPQSPKQSMRLLKELYGLPSTCFKKKDGTYGVDERALERVAKKRPALKPVCDLMLEVRGIKKQIGFLDCRLTADGRYPSSFNVGAAWTGRWSSSKNPYHQGGNMQNIAERHRGIFRADPGMEMFYADLEQAESRVVAYLAGDEDYILAHSLGDVHTYVARLLWPSLPWTGDLLKDKGVASANPPWDAAPGHNYRFQAKRIQHGGNYGLSPQGISMIARIPLAEAKKAYEQYHEAFPYISHWQRSIRAKVVGSEALINPLGRRIRLFGRPWDEHTYKQGLSFIPQSTVADVLNLALWHLWSAHDPALVQVLAQVHDAILGQYPVVQRESAILAIREKMTIPVTIGDRVCVIPVEVAAGRNWGKKSEANPNGMEKV